MIRTIIIDDDEKARNSLQDHIGVYCKNIEIAAMADSVTSGIYEIIKNKPDLVFLDIEMQDGSGFDLLERIKNITFKVIFYTAFHKYAVRAFKFSAIDYLLKPIDPDELVDAVLKAEKNLENESLELKLNTFYTHFNDKTQDKKKMILKTQDQIYYINIDDIIHCRSDKNYTQFNLEDKRTVVVSKTLKEYEELLNECGFYRVHQSHLVNLKQVVSYNKIKNKKSIKELDELGDCEGYLVLKDQTKIPVSQRKKTILLKLLEKY